MNENTETKTRTPAERVQTLEKHAELFAAARSDLEQRRYERAIAAGVGPARAAQEAAEWAGRWAERTEELLYRARMDLAAEEAAAEVQAEADEFAPEQGRGLRATLRHELDQTPTIKDMLTPGYDRWGAIDAIGGLPAMLPAWLQYTLVLGGLALIAVLTVLG